MTGIPLLMIPAFSPAIFSNVLPRNWVWSKLILVMIHRSGCTILVQSSLPPSPTSITATSTCSSAKYRNAIAVVNSKKEGCRGSKITFFFYKPDYIFFRDRLSVYSDTFAEIYEVRRCVEAYPVPRFLQDSSKSVRA